MSELFNDIAADNRISLRFDPRPNVERKDALPPEDHLPRGVIRNPERPSSKLLLARRANQRRIRREHENVVGEIGHLEQREQELVSAIAAQLDGMDSLSSLQSTKEQKPLPIEVAMSALMDAGISVEHQLAIEGVGVFFGVDGTVLVDAGERILVDGEIEGDVLRAVHIMARKKNWRDLDLVDLFDMPMPVPPEPARKEIRPEKGSAKRRRMEQLGKGGIVHAAREVARTLGTSEDGGRAAILDRVIRNGDDHLIQLVTLLARQNDNDAIDDRLISAMFDEVLGSDCGLWARYKLEQDLRIMTTPGSALSRPFNPPASFYERYGVTLPGDRGGMSAMPQVAGR